MNTLPHLRSLIVLAACSLGLSAAAQSTVAPAPLEKDRDDVVQLSPFTVSTEKDTGYMATDVMSGGRLATNLLKTATDVTVLTREFLDDVGTNNIQDVQIWLTGSDPAANTVNATNPTDFGTAAGFRGLAGTTNTRNYFRNDFAPEEYVTERIEGSRGPNGILYGDATQAGKVNVTTKRAVFRDLTTLRLRLDSFGDPLGVGTYLDVNRRLGKRWAARVNAQYKEGEQWYDRSQDDHRGAQVVTSFRPWRGGELRFEVERDIIDRTSLRPDSLFDTQSSWDRTTTIAGPLSANPAAGTGLARFTSDTWVYVEGIGVQNRRNFARTTGTNLSTLTDLGEGRGNFAHMPTIPFREFNINSPLEKVRADQRNYNVTFEQQFDSGLVIEAAYNHSQAVRTGDTLFFSNSYIDVNQVLPDGRPNPNFGKTYSETNGWNPIRTGSYTTSARLAAAFPWKTKWFSNTFSVVAEWRDRLDDFAAQQYFRDNGLLSPNGATSSALDNNQRVVIWRYWDQPDAPANLPVDDANNKYRWVISRDQHSTNQLRSIQANMVGSYLHDKLTIVGGVRHDLYKGQTRDVQRRDRVTGTPTQVGGVSSEVTSNTPQIGATYFPIEQAGVYVYKSDGFLPSTINTPKLDGSVAYNLAVSKSWGAGLRFKLLDHRIVGSIGYYDSFEKDRNSQIQLSTINNVWTAIGNAGGPNNSIVQTGGLAQYTDVSTLNSWGWEGELTANLSRALRLTINASIPKTSQTDGLRDTRAYYSENIGLWAQYRATAAVNTAVNAVESLLAGSVNNRAQNGLYKHRVNFFANYTVQSGPLKNLRIGAGANIFGEMLIGNVANQPFEFVYADSYYLATVTFGYSRKIAGVPVDFNLRIANALNYQEPIFRANSVVTIAGQVYRNNYYWPVPRSVQLTTTVRF
ncbi:MAG TPA: hypothetical protein VK477_00280 [Acidobacteriota bacterium]|nr:hypothetical protein [Acidobacteriota bacterium]